MTKDELLNGLQSIATQMRRWEARKIEVDREHPMDDLRPATEQWGQDLRNVLQWRNEIETMLVEYRKIVAIALQRKTSQQWTAEDMMELLNE